MREAYGVHRRMSERSFFPSLKASALAGVAVAVLLTSSMVAGAQVTGSSQTTTDANGQQQESVPLSAVRGVMITHVVARPQEYQPGSLGREITLTLGWGAVSRIDLMPATCADPDCDADHGYEGSVASDDISLRISADAEGEAALQQALGFARELSASIGS